MATVKRFLGVFDFDNTIIDGNSDVVVRNLLSNSSIPQETEKMAKDGRWTAYMREVFSLLHEQGISEDIICSAIVEIPPAPFMIFLLNRLRRMNCDTIIISDSNTYFIDKWLKSNNVNWCVDATYSNPAEFVNGKLNISEYHLQDWCSLSEINLCKGYVMEQHIENQKKQGITYKTVFYVGDGHNDLCPSLKLRQNDIVFPRIGFPLVDLIKKSNEIKAKVEPWTASLEIVSYLSYLRNM